MPEEVKKEDFVEEENKNMRIIEMIVMIIFGFFALLPLILYGYHFFI